MCDRARADALELVSFAGLEAALAGYRVVVLAGYSGLDDQHREMLRKQIRAQVAQIGARTAYVLGASVDGFGRAYGWIPELASKQGLGQIVTAGIVSRNTSEYGIAPQDDVVSVGPVDDH